MPPGPAAGWGRRRLGPPPAPGPSRPQGGGNERYGGGFTRRRSAWHPLAAAAPGPPPPPAGPVPRAGPVARSGGRACRAAGGPGHPGSRRVDVVRLWPWTCWPAEAARARADPRWSRWSTRTWRPGGAAARRPGTPWSWPTGLLGPGDVPSGLWVVGPWPAAACWRWGEGVHRAGPARPARGWPAGPGAWPTASPPRLLPEDVRGAGSMPTRPGAQGGRAGGACCWPGGRGNAPAGPAELSGRARPPEPYGAGRGASVLRCRILSCRATIVVELVELTTPVAR